MNVRHVKCSGLGNKLGAWEKGKWSILTTISTGKIEMFELAIE